MWFTYQLGKRLKRLYADSDLPRDRGFKNMVWDFEHDDPRRAPARRAERAEGPEGDQRLLQRRPGRHLGGFAELKDDGSTTCASWIYCGVFPSPDENRSANREPDPPGTRGGAQLGWGFAWPANRRIMYNRASADPQGRPWSERKKYIWWDDAEEQWTGYDVPDFPRDQAARATRASRARPAWTRFRAPTPFIMKSDGHGWLYVPTGLVDGPLPTHYEPAESVVRNPLYRQQSSPVLKHWKRAGNPTRGGAAIRSSRTSSPPIASPSTTSPAR